MSVLDEIIDGVRADLAAVGKDPSQHLAEQTAATLFGALIVPAAAYGQSGSSSITERTDCRSICSI